MKNTCAKLAQCGKTVIEMKKVIGITCLVSGIAIASYAMTMSISVNYNVKSIVYTGEPSTFANLDLMNRRICFMILASALSIVGTILIAVPEPIKGNNNDEQKQLLLSQLNMLSSIAGKLDVPIEEINEVMEPYGVTFEP